MFVTEIGYTPWLGLGERVRREKGKEVYFARE